jgi:hypothetical protein
MQFIFRRPKTMAFKKSLFLFLVLAGLFLYCGTAEAYYTVKFNSDAKTPYNSGSGGEFTLNVKEAPLTNFVSNYYSDFTRNQKGYIESSYISTFESFCLEKTEGISFSGTYYAVLNNSAVNGGGGAQNGKDPISAGTAWLYYNFVKGTLSGSGYSYNYSITSERLKDANALQQTIWYLEDEISWSAFTADHKFYNAAVANITGDVKANANGAYGVKVLNLYTTYNSKTDTLSGLSQDQLIVTPIPSALLLLGPALIGLVGFRKRIF